MGCIVNGPGEMADADFGYVGGTPGKIDLYVGKVCQRYSGGYIFAQFKDVVYDICSIPKLMISVFFHIAKARGISYDRNSIIA